MKTNKQTSGVGNYLKFRNAKDETITLNKAELQELIDNMEDSDVLEIPSDSEGYYLD